jgi:hypothetical protein
MRDRYQESEARMRGMAFGQPEPGSRTRNTLPLGSLFIWIALLLACFASPFGGVQAQGPGARGESEPANGKTPFDLRELYVPVESLEAAVKRDTYGAILSRKEFETLLRAARERDDETGPSFREAVLSSAEYQAQIDGERLVTEVSVHLRTFPRSAPSVALHIGGWNVEQVRVDGDPAFVTRAGEDDETLRISVAGSEEPDAQSRMRTITLTLSTPLATVGSDKVAAFSLLGVPAEQFSITLPEGKFLRVNGAAVGTQASVRGNHFEIPVGGRERLELVISDHQHEARADLLTFASTAYGLNVLPGEVTWIARSDLQVFGRRIERLTCRVPSTLEITSVESPGLESWELADAPAAADGPHDSGSTLITLQYRQGFEGNRTILFRGILSASAGEVWQVPVLSISQVSAHVGVVLVQSPENVRLQPVEASGLRSIPPEEIRQPPLANGESPGGRNRIAYQSWHEDFILRFLIALKEQQVHAAMTTLLHVGRTELELAATLDLESRLAPLFDVRIRLPAEWQVDSVQVEGKRRDWERVPVEEGISEIRIPLPEPLLPGRRQTVRLLARFEPEGFPVQARAGEDTPPRAVGSDLPLPPDQDAGGEISNELREGPGVRIALPAVQLPQAAMVEARYGITGEEDLELVPVDIIGLDPARQWDGEGGQGEPVSVRLGYNYQDTVFSGALEVSRRPARLTTETLTFFRMEEEMHVTRLEAMLHVTGGGLRELELMVSEPAGERLRFLLFEVPDLAAHHVPPSTLIPQRIMEQRPGEPVDGMRPWRLRLDRYLRGRYLLVTEIQTDPLGEGERSGQPPALLFPQSETQSGFIAIEGAPDELTEITAVDADGLPLRRVDPVDFPRRLEARIQEPGNRRQGSDAGTPNPERREPKTPSLDEGPPRAVGLELPLRGHSKSGAEAPNEPREGPGGTRMVAGYRYVSPGWRVEVTRRRFDRGTVPTAVGHLAELTSTFRLSRPRPDADQGSVAGTFHHQARITFTAVGAESLLVRLPEGARLWSTLIDGIPIEIRRPEREAADPAVAVPAVTVPLDRIDVTKQHVLTLLYSTPVADVSTLRSTPPELTVVGGTGQRQPLEILRHRWTVSHPPETVLLESLGRFQPLEPLMRETLLSRLTERFQRPTARSIAEGGLAVGIVVVILFLVGWIRRRTARHGLVLSLASVAGVLVISGIVLVVMTPSRYQPGRPAAEALPGGYSVADDVDAMPAGAFDDSSSPAYNFSSYNAATVSPSEKPMQMSEPMRTRRRSDPIADTELHAAPKQEKSEAGLSFNGTLSDQKPDDTPFGSVDPDFQPPASEFSFDADPSQRAQPGADAPPARPARSEQDDIPDEFRVRDSQVPTLGMPISGRERFRPAAGGLLSMTFDLQVPEGFRQHGFEYRGNGVATDEITLHVQLADRERGGLMQWAVALGVLLVGWWLRPTTVASIRRSPPSRRQLAWVFLTIVLPIGLLGLVPNRWLFLLEGVLYGGLASVLFWLLAGCWQCCLNRAFPLGLLWQPGQRGRSSMDALSILNRGGKGPRTVGLLLIGMLGWATSGTAYGADEEPPAVGVADSAPNPGDSAFDPFVLIPYESLETLPAASRVWVPQAVYKTLLRAAGFEPPDDATEAAVVEATYAGRIVEADEARQVLVQCRWVVAARGEAAVSLPLPVRNGALEAVRLDGQPATVTTGESGQAHVLLPSSPPREPASSLRIRSAPDRLHVIDARLRLPVESAAAGDDASFGRFQLKLEPVGSGVFSFELPPSEDELHVRVNGNTSAYRRLRRDERSIIELPIDREGTLTFAWQPATRRADTDRIVHLETTLAARFDDAGLTLDHHYRVQVRQGEVQDLSFDLPDGVSLQGIDGADVGGWELFPAAAVTDAKSGTEDVDEDRRRLRIFFRRTLTDETRFRVRLFRSLTVDDPPLRVPVAMLTPRDVTRETVQAGLFATDVLRLRALEAEGLQQIEPRRFDLSVFQPVGEEGRNGESEGSREPPQLAWRFSTRPVRLEVSVGRRETEMQAVVEHGVHVAARKLLIASRIELQLTNAPRRQIEITLPEGYLVIDVVCAEARDWHTSSANGVQRLTLELDRPRTGRIEIGLEGHVIKEPDETPVAVTLPRPVGGTRLSSTLGIWIDEAYQSTIGGLGNWRPTPPGQLPGRIRSLRPNEPQFGFTSGDDDPGPVELGLSRAVPELRADAVTLIAVSDATIDYGLTLRWRITTAASDRFTFTTPDWLGRLEITGPGIRQVRSEEAGDGRRRWRVELIEPVREEYLLTAAATVSAPADRIVNTPEIEFERAADGQARSTLEVQRQFAILVSLSGDQLVPIDPERFDSVSIDDVPIQVHDELTQQAMEVVRVRSGQVPRWRQQRMETVADAGGSAIVLSASLTTVLEPDGSWRTRAVYAVRNRGRQFLALDLTRAATGGSPGASAPGAFEERSGSSQRTPRGAATAVDSQLPLQGPRRTGAGVPNEPREGHGRDGSGEARILSVFVRGEPSRTVTERLEDKVIHLIALPRTSAADLSFDVEILLAGRLPQPLPGLSGARTLRSRNVSLPVPEVVSPGESGEFGLPVAQTLWTVHVPDDLDVSFVSGPGRTNLTPHDEQGWLMRERHLLERYKADLAEMKQLALSSTASESQRAQALGNLKELGEALQASEGSVRQRSGEYTLKGKLGDYVTETRELYRETQEALDEAGRAAAQARPAQQLGIDNGRKFIVESNTIILSNNAGAGIQFDETSRQRFLTEGSLEGLNFFSPDDARRGGESSKSGIVMEQRSRLREQLQRQSPIVGQEAGSGLRFGRPETPGMGMGMGAMGMGGGIGETGGRPADAPVDGSTFSDRAAAVHEEAAFARFPLPARTWTAAGGLSVEMEIPVTGRQLTFSKVGGNPELTLSVRPKESYALLLGAVWLLLSLVVGGWLCVQSVTGAGKAREGEPGDGTGSAGPAPSSPGELLRPVAVLAMLAGLAGTFLLPGDLRWPFFALFCLGGLVIALQPLRSDRTKGELA